jgi:hypothetical protein
MRVINSSGLWWFKVKREGADEPRMDGNPF